MTTKRFKEYFAIFPWNDLPDRAVGVDVGCGSGRWAVRVAPKVGTLHCVDASEQALVVARRNLARQPNCTFHLVASMPFHFRRAAWTLSTPSACCTMFQTPWPVLNHAFRC